MTKTAFLHVGLPKTATTTLQHYFLDELSGPASPLCYVPVGLSLNSKEGFAHHNLPRGLANAEKVSDRFDPACGTPDDIAAFMLGDTTGRPMLLSSEGLWGVAGRTIPKQRLTEFLDRLRPSYRIVILVTWRNYVDYLLSTYFHAAKFRPPKDMLAAPDIDQMHATFMKKLDFLAGVADEVVVFRYSRSVVPDYLAFLAAAIGRELPPIQPDKMHNPSLNDGQRAFALAVAARDKPMPKRRYKLKLRAITDDTKQDVDLGFDTDALRTRAAAMSAELRTTDTVRLIG